MLAGLDAASVMRAHDAALREHACSGGGSGGSGGGSGGDGLWHAIAANHRYNCQLWAEEDKARRTDVGTAEIAASKRLIDQYNQRRNDAVEAVDEAILAQLDGMAQVPPGARLSSETAGAMIDRLSILALKIFHMRQQSERGDASAAHRDACWLKFERLQLQRHDLACCLDRLLDEAASGQAYFKVYRQYKMYNDPTLNPWLYGQAGAAGGAAP